MPRPRGPVKRVVSFRFKDDLYEQAQEACYWERVYLTEVLEDYLEEWVKRMQAKHNSGRPFRGEHREKS